MENIIETLLWLSREDRVTDQNQVFDAVSLVREIIKQHQYLIVDKPIDIELFPENNPKLSIPSTIFQIMLTNLIRNAIQHTASGNIRVVVYNDRVSVSDTGAGMAPDELNLIAQSRVCKDRYKGLGLGLSIVRRLCDRLGWELKIESEKGNGTTVQLIFPSVKV